MSQRGIVVTGATGIAAATARRLSERGDILFVVSRRAETAEALAASLPGRSGWHEADLADESATVAAFEAAERSLGRIDGVVAVAGGSARRHGDGLLHTMSLDAWEATLRMNLTTVFLTARESLLRLRENGGSLVLTSSVLAWSPQPGGFGTHGYATAKAAIVGLTTTLAAAYAPDGVRVNCVAPGLIRTPMSKRAQEDTEVLAFAARKQPLAGGMLDAEPVAAANCWALDAEGVTGQVIAVDGGWTVTSTS